MEEKHYSYWKKVVVWKKTEFTAPDLDEAIRMIDEEDFGDNWFGEEYGDDEYELEPDEDGIINYRSTYPITRELYEEGGDMVWDNKPIKIVRQERLDKILKD